MAAPAITPEISETPRIRFNWIIDRRNDLIWYIGSALVAWLYIAIIFTLVGFVPDDPVEGVITTLTLGGISIPITLQLLVVISWGWYIDAPHVFATLARTFTDPEEWKTRGRKFWLSWLWFGFGPLIISIPYFIGAGLEPFGIKLDELWLNLGYIIYFVFFRLWAYYHVVRQHWGFFSLYKRRNDDVADTRNNQIDTWFFNLSMYLPLIMFMTSTHYANVKGFPNLGLRTPLIGDWSIGSLMYPLAWALYLAAITGYLVWQAKLWRESKPLNGSKLLFMLSIVPLHLMVFMNPILVLFLVPLVTVGHNLQYHRIVWTYGQNKYKEEKRPGYALAHSIFSNLWIYILLGLVFTFAVYKGPWVEFVRGVTGLNLDTSLYNGISMMAGIADPTKLELGDKIFAALLTGWAMQHYYLDGYIWKVNRDKSVTENLKV
jgi:hypothetical protein